jgi:PPP family 3-phenylpropionic acid transporter
MPTRTGSPIYSIATNFFFLFAAFAVIAPYLQLFFAVQGFSPAEVGLLLGIYQVAGMMGPLLIAHLADRTGRFRTIRSTTIVLATVAFIVLNSVAGFAPAAALAFGAGFLFRAAIPLTDAHASNLMVRPELEYGRARFVGSIGFIVCSAVIQLTGHLAGASGTEIVGTIVVLLLVYLAVIVLMPSVRGRGSGAESPLEQGLSGFDRPFVLFMAIILVAQTGMAAHNSFFSLYLEEQIGPGLVSGMWAVGAAAEVPFILFAGFFIRRFGIRLMLTLGFLSMTIRFLVYAFVPIPSVIFGVQVLHAASFGLVHTASIGYINRRFPARQRGLAIAVYSSVAMSLSMFVGSSLGGFVVEAAGFQGLFLAYSALPLAGTALLTAFHRRLNL